MRPCATLFHSSYFKLSIDGALTYFCVCSFAQMATIIVWVSFMHVTKRRIIHRIPIWTVLLYVVVCLCVRLKLDESISCIVVPSLISFFHSSMLIRENHRKNISMSAIETSSLVVYEFQHKLLGIHDFHSTRKKKYIYKKMMSSSFDTAIGTHKKFAKRFFFSRSQIITVWIGQVH